jgi:hypothetical protein
VARVPEAVTGDLPVGTFRTGGDDRSRPSAEGDGQLRPIRPWLASQFDYRGVWSFPVRLGTEDAVGTFALYFSEPRDATERDYEFASVMTHAAAILISHDRRHSEGPPQAVGSEPSAPGDQEDDALSVLDATRSAIEETRRLLAETDQTYAQWRRYLEV